MLVYLKKEVSKITNSLQFLRKESDGSGLVKISASWQFVSMYLKITSFYST